MALKRIIAALAATVFIFLFISGAAAEYAKTTDLPDSAPDNQAEEEIFLPIVMYHNISEKSRLWGDYVVSVSEFERDLCYLRSEGYESVTVRELLDWNEGNGELPEKPFMITFDDGFESTSVLAGPLLEEYGFTAVIAVIGSASDLATAEPDHNLDYTHLSWEALSELSWGDVFEVQCHTYNMHKLGSRRGCGKMRGEDSDAYREALIEDISIFRSRCGEYNVRLAPSFAFPYGRYSKETLEIAGDLGFKAVFTCLERVNKLRRAPGEMLELNRYNRAHGKSSESFFKKWRTDE